MNNTQTKYNTAINATQDKDSSLRGEAPQEHVVKGKKVNSKTKEARALLSKLSQEAKIRREMLVSKAKTDAEKLHALSLTINDVLIATYQAQTGCTTFKTFNNWKKEGYHVKKGETAFRIWGRPLQVSDTITNEQGEELNSDPWEFWPMCCIFNENQVEKPNGDQLEREPKAAEKQPANNNVDETTNNVKVSKFRGAIEHLERVFCVDRHSCVGDKEKNYWRGICENVLAELLRLTCKTAKPKDTERRDSIVERVQKYLSETQPTPPEPTTKKTENKTLDLGNNESLTRGLFPEADGTFTAMTFTESKPFRTEHGALTWLAARGLDAKGEKIVEQVETVENNPFVNPDLEEMTEAKKDRLLERAEKKEQESEAMHRKSRSHTEHIPFGQPILVGHHSERRHRKAIDNSWRDLGKAVALSDYSDNLKSRAESVGTGGIASNDPEAITKLKDKLASLIENQETMKAVNKALRAGSDEALTKLGYSDKKIELLKKPDCFGGIGFASYSLSNNSAEIRRTKKRIEELTRLHNSKPIDFSNDDFAMSVDNGQVKIDFSGGKPSDDVRTLVKRYSFKWSRYQTAWVRKATANGVAAAEQLCNDLQKLDEIY